MFRRLSINAANPALKPFSSVVKVTRQRRVTSLLLLLHLLEIELKLSSLKDVSIASSGLSRSGGDAGENLTEVELVSKLLVDNSILVVHLDLSKNVTGSLGLSGLGLFELLFVELNIVVLEVPLSEGSGINGDDAVLDDSLGSNELVVGGVVNNIENSGLSGDGLRTPGEATSINSKRTVLHVATSASDGSHSFLTQFSHSWLSTQFELSFLLMNWHAASSGPSFVS